MQAETLSHEHISMLSCLNADLSVVMFKCRSACLELHLMLSQEYLPPEHHSGKDMLYYPDK